MKERKKSSLCFFDYFIIVTVLLLIVGIMGQDVAVYAINKYNSEQKFQVCFLSRTVDKQKVLEMFSSVEGETAGTLLKAGDRTLGEVLEKPTLEAVAPVEDTQKAENVKYNLKGSFYSEGRMKDEGVRLAKFGKIETGDILMVTVGKQALTIEITEIHLISQSESTVK